MEAGCQCMENSELQPISSSVKIRTYRCLKFVLQICSKKLVLHFFISRCVSLFSFSFFMLVSLLHFIPSIAPYGIHSTLFPNTQKFSFPTLTILTQFLFHPCCRYNPQPIFVSDRVFYEVLTYVSMAYFTHIPIFQSLDIYTKQFFPYFYPSWYNVLIPQEE